MGKVLGIDYGLKRCGIAISDEERSWAFPRETLDATSENDLINRIVQLVGDERVEEIVVGKPRAQAGSDTEMTQKTAAFVEELSDHVAIPVRTVDERMTSRFAERMLQESQKSGATADRDAVAAAAILQMYLQTRA